MFKYIFSKPIVYIIILVFVVFIIILILFGNAAKKQVKNDVPLQTLTPSATITQDKVEELKIEDLVVGTGIEAVNGKTVTVNYLGTLTDGTKFDSSYDRGAPFSFNLGAGEVIAGWDQGVVGMKIGGKRKLTVPSSLGYGETGAGEVIPPNATLIFEVELLKVE